MPDANLAPKFQTLFKLLSLLRKTPLDRQNIDQLRSATSQWVSNHCLRSLPAVQTFDHEIAEGLGWREFRSSDADPGRNLFYIHGGGLVFYSVDDFHSLLAHWAVLSAVPVTGFYYPKAPAHGIDQIVEQLAAAIGACCATLPPGNRIILGGDSIGAFLALQIVLRKFPRRFSSAVLIYPVLDLTHERASYEKYGHGYPLDAQLMRWIKNLSNAKNSSELVDLFGLTDDQISSLPDIRIYSAEYDVLRDESFDWASYLKSKSRDVVHQHFDDLPHDFCLYAGSVPEAKRAVDIIGQDFGGISAAFGKRMPDRQRAMGPATEEGIR